LNRPGLGRGYFYTLGEDPLDEEDDEGDDRPDLFEVQDTDQGD
jgi:hypothetical protein